MLTRSHQRTTGIRKSACKPPPITVREINMEDSKKYLKEGTVKPFLYGRPASTYGIAYDPLVTLLPEYVQNPIQTGARTIFDNDIMSPYVSSEFSFCMFVQPSDSANYNPVQFSTTSSESPQSGLYVWTKNTEPWRVRLLGHFADSGTAYNLISMTFVNARFDVTKMNFLGVTYRSIDGRFMFNLNGEIMTYYNATLGELLHENPKPVTVAGLSDGYSKIGAYRVSNKYMTDSEVNGFFNKYRHLYPDLETKR